MTNKKEVQNILLISLSESLSKRVAFVLSEHLDMYNIDCHDMIVYDLINPKEVVDKCGIEYFEKRERSVINSCASYLNTCISINFDLILKYNKQFDKSLIIYLKLPHEKISKVPNKINFKNRNDYLENIADEVISLEKKSINIAVDKIIKKLGERYENS